MTFTNESSISKIMWQQIWVWFKKSDDNMPKDSVSDHDHNKKPDDNNDAANNNATND